MPQNTSRKSLFSAGDSSGTGANGDRVDTSAVGGTFPDAVFDTERFGTTTYALSGLTPGAAYLLRLDFAEIYWNGPGRSG